MSGNPLFPYTEKLVESVHNNFEKLPIIACGGITNGNKAWTLLNKGASLFEIYSGITFYGLRLIIEINNTLETKLANDSIDTFIEKHHNKTI
uniref:Dihydroorotate dehydrogenase n=1 Tax=uncultured marine thaumarchaeote AD1000_11_E10 TaxID=1455890 RepID=A0A075FJ49_9ARCH|nr:Dihydroorotate dehydrogenase [uncultured marine thaumarchaeote AD1000_11_E10]